MLSFFHSNYTGVFIILYFSFHRKHRLGVCVAKWGLQKMLGILALYNPIHVQNVIWLFWECIEDGIPMPLDKLDGSVTRSNMRSIVCCTITDR